MIDPQQYNAPWQQLGQDTMVVDADYRPVCAMAAASLSGRHRKQAMVNAKLIAASPQLLQAAWVALEYLSNTLNGDPDDPALTAWNALADAVAEATSLDA